MTTFNKNNPKDHLKVVSQGEYTTADFKNWYGEKFSWLYKPNQFDVIESTDRTVLMYRLVKENITSTDCTKKRYSLYKLNTRSARPPSGGIQHQFVEIMDSLDYDVVYKEYQRRLDPTVDLTLYAKIHSIIDTNVKECISYMYNHYKSQQQIGSKGDTIPFDVRLEQLANLTTSELIDYTKSIMAKNKSNEVFWNKFLNVM